MENRLTKKELRQIWKRWGFTHLSSMSYEKLQAHTWAYSYLPFAEKYYKNDEEAKRRLLLRHSMFYNTEPQTGQLINGIVASLEEEIAIGGDVPEEMPVNIKTTLMGPLAGIGDSIIQGIIVSYGIIGPLISYLCFMNGYRLGVNAIDVIIGENAKRITDAFNILGIMVVGGLAASNIALTTAIKIPMGDEVQKLQTVLDGIFPNVLPLMMVLLAWYLLTSKQMTATKIILVLTVISAIGVVIGVF